MFSHQQMRSSVGACRWGSGQPGSVARSPVVGRLVVANATRLPAKAEAEEEAAVFSVSSGLQLKARRSRAAAPQPTLTVNDDTVDPQTQFASGSDAINGADDASQRDATATASTSGNNGLHLRSQSAAALKQRKLPLRTAAAPAGTPREPGLPFPDSSGFDPPPAAHQHQHHDNTAPAAAAAAGSQGSGSAEGAEPPRLPPQPSRPPVHPLPAGVTPERDLDIHNELRGCEDWRDVLDVVADEAACLSVRTAVQALTRLNTLTRGSAAARRELVEAPGFQTLKEVLFSQVSLMNNIQLANSLQALAQLQVKLPELLLEGYATAVTARADTFYPRDIATLLAAAAALRWSPPRELLDAMGFRAMGFLNSQEFDARSIPTLLHSIALLGYNNNLLAQAAAQRLAAPGVVPSLVPQGVANSMWALGRLHTYHPPAVAAALAAFSSAPLSYKPQEVANLLWSLTSFRHHPEGAFVLFARSLISPGQGQGQVRAADVATLLYALALFNVPPGERVLERLEAAALALLGPEATAAGGAGEDAAAAAEAAPKAAGRGALAVVELAHMYWGLALLGAVEGPLFGRLEKELAAAWAREGSEIPQSLLRTVFQGFLASRLESPRRAHGFPPLALDALKRAWTSSVVEESSKRGRGRRVDQVAAILDSLKVTYDKRRPTGDGLAVIDIALKAGPERYIALQVVDTWDRCTNSKQLLGPAVVVGQVLEKNGWEVRYLRTSDLDSLAPEVQSRFVEELLRGMGVRVRKGSAAAAAGAGAGAGAAPAGSAASAARQGRPAVRGCGDVAADADVQVGGARAARSSSSLSPSSSRALKTRSRR